MALTEEAARTPETIKPAVAITAEAAKQVQRSLAKQNLARPGAFLRLAVKGGGCSGLSYVMEPDYETDERDRTWTHEAGFKVVIDSKSLDFLTGVTLDWDIKNLMEGGFVWRNPNAARTCGCGTSFTPA